ncbi:MAG: hypothetical protein AB4426_10545 [Xenococcaceae cyanobacterium]
MKGILKPILLAVLIGMVTVGGLLYVMLSDIRTWLVQENATIMLVVCGILGAKFLGDGIKILTG